MQVSAACRTDALITALRGPSLYAVANNKLIVREVGVFNTTATECRVGLGRTGTTGTQGTALTEAPWDPDAPAIGTAFNTHTADVTSITGILRLVTLPAAIGSGYVWTFGRNGLVIPKGTANGIMIYLPGGTAQHIEVYFDWDE